MDDEYTEKDWHADLARQLDLSPDQRAQLPNLMADWCGHVELYLQDAETNPLPTDTAKELKKLQKMAAAFNDALDGMSVDAWMNVALAIDKTPLCQPERKHFVNWLPEPAPEGADFKAGDQFFVVWPDHPLSHRVYECQDRKISRWSDGSKHDSVIYSDEFGKRRQFQHKHCWNTSDLETALAPRSQPKIQDNGGLSFLDMLRANTSTFETFTRVAARQLREKTGRNRLAKKVDAKRAALLELCSIYENLTGKRATSTPDKAFDRYASTAFHGVPELPPYNQTDLIETVPKYIRTPG